jgi:hypothetical protein
MDTEMSPRIKSLQGAQLVLAYESAVAAVQPRSVLYWPTTAETLLISYTSFFTLDLRVPGEGVSAEALQAELARLYVKQYLRGHRKEEDEFEQSLRDVSPPLHPIHAAALANEAALMSWEQRTSEGSELFVDVVPLGGEKYRVSFGNHCILACIVTHTLQHPTLFVNRERVTLTWSTLESSAPLLPVSSRPEDAALLVMQVIQNMFGRRGAIKALRAVGLLHEPRVLRNVLIMDYPLPLRTSPLHGAPELLAQRIREEATGSKKKKNPTPWPKYQVELIVPPRSPPPPLLSELKSWGILGEGGCLLSESLQQQRPAPPVSVSPSSSSSTTTMVVKTTTPRVIKHTPLAADDNMGGKRRRDQLRSITSTLDYQTFQRLLNKHGVERSALLRHYRLSFLEAWHAEQARKATAFYVDNLHVVVQQALIDAWLEYKERKETEMRAIGKEGVEVDRKHYRTPMWLDELERRLIVKEGE